MLTRQRAIHWTVMTAVVALILTVEFCAMQAVRTKHRNKRVMLYCTVFFSALLGTISCSEVSRSQSPNSKSMENQSNNPYYSRTDTSKLNVSNEEWKRILSPEVYHIAREKGTERAFTGKYWETDELGTYYCAVCGNKLFISDSKFGSSCGWPSFFETVRKDAATYHEDRSFGMHRVEVCCGRCESHLGHIFNDGPPPTGMRYCMNSAVLDFVPREE